MFRQKIKDPFRFGFGSPLFLLLLLPSSSDSQIREREK
ncbi:hypothetical protein AALP_AA8G390500 [Arabis alpina]|uniref:Uncharacterized protein n=1 Tax=Arabis alpina TaxID=50452 RepID=A0A087GC95_ARAAL|nr:hypothetical protein AALP_AA8G390500 [Arabis alpina]